MWQHKVQNNKWMVETWGPHRDTKHYFAAWFFIPLLCLFLSGDKCSTQVWLNQFSRFCLLAAGAFTGASDQGPRSCPAPGSHLWSVNSIVWYLGFNAGPAKEILLHMFSAPAAALGQCYCVIKWAALLEGAAAQEMILPVYVMIHSMFTGSNSCLEAGPWRAYVLLAVSSGIPDWIPRINTWNFFFYLEATWGCCDQYKWGRN